MSGSSAASTSEGKPETPIRWRPTRSAPTRQLNELKAARAAARAASLLGRSRTNAHELMNHLLAARSQLPLAPTLLPVGAGARRREPRSGPRARGAFEAADEQGRPDAPRACQG